MHTQLSLFFFHTYILKLLCYHQYNAKTNFFSYDNKTCYLVLHKNLPLINLISVFLHWRRSKILNCFPLPPSTTFLSFPPLSSSVVDGWTDESNSTKKRGRHTHTHTRTYADILFYYNPIFEGNKAYINMFLFFLYIFHHRYTFTKRSWI